MKRIFMIFSIFLICLTLATPSFARDGRGGPKARVFTNTSLPSNEQNTDPTAADDASRGYKIGDFRVNELTNTSWQCIDNTIGIAMWLPVGSGTSAFTVTGTFAVVHSGVSLIQIGGTSGDTIYVPTLNTPSLNSDAYGVTQTQTQATLPLKGIAQGTAAGVIYRADYNASGVTTIAIMQNGDVITYKDDGTIGEYWDASTGNKGIGTTDPGTYKLNVNGTGNIGGKLDVQGNIEISYSNYIGSSIPSGLGAPRAYYQPMDSFGSSYLANLYAGGNGFIDFQTATVQGTGISRMRLGSDGGVGIGTTVLSPFTKAMEFGTGTTGTPVGPGFVAYKDTESGVSKMHAYDRSGTFASLSSFNPETGKAERTEVNIYAGIKATWKDDGTVEYVSVPKVNPEEAHKELFVKAYQADEKNAKWKTCDQSEAISGMTKEVITPITDKKWVKQFKKETGKVETVEETYKLTEVKEVVSDGFRIKDGYRLNEITGQFEKKIIPTKAEAEAKFTFDWSKWPKYIRQAWGK